MTALPWLALGFVLGLVWGAEWRPATGGLALLLASMTAAGALLLRAGLHIGLLVLLLAGVLAGVLRAGAAPGTPGDTLIAAHGEAVSIRGVVTSAPEVVGPRLRIALHVYELRLEDIPATGGAWRAVDGALVAWASPLVPPLPGRLHPYMESGDAVTLSGRLSAPLSGPGFDYARVLAVQGVYSVLNRAEVDEVRPAAGQPALLISEARRALARSVARSMPEPEASVAQGLVFGLRGGIPPDLSDAFRRSGTTHLLAISGMHVATLLTLALAVSQALLGRRRYVYLAAPGIAMWGYIMLAGVPPSAMRAGVMGSVYLLALAVGRQPHPVNAIALAAIGMLAWEPGWLWQPSFQLSFAAMAGLLLIGLPLWERVRRRLTAAQRRRLPTRIAALVAEWTIGALLISFGASLASLPLVAYHFQSLPLLGIPATIVLLPVVPALLVGGFAAGVAGLLWGPAGTVVGLVPTAAAWLLNAVARAASAPGWSALAVSRPSAALLWAAYASIALGIAVVYWRLWAAPLSRSVALAWGRRLAVEDQALLLLSLALVAALPWTVVSTRVERMLEVAVLGEAGSPIYVRTPGGADLLLDGDTDPRSAVVALDRLMPGPAGAVEFAMLSRDVPNPSSVLMDLARRGRILCVVAPAGAAGVWRDELRMLGVKLVDATPGLLLRFDDGARAEVVAGTPVSGQATVGLRVAFHDAQLDLPAAFATVQGAGVTRLRSDGFGWWRVR